MESIAIINFVKGSKGQSRGGMAAVMRYASQDIKTQWEDTKLVSGVNCHPNSAYNDFLRTQLLHHKDSGRRFYHLVQSFPKNEKVDPRQAHLCARKLAEFFEDREVLVCTHTDRDHIHSRLVINAVALESGRKLHSDKALIEKLMRYNDKVCMEFNLPVFQPEQQKSKTKSLSNAEYHIAAKGMSWKFRMMNTIDNCMRFASTRDEFIELMSSEGYKVKWTPGRKNITYTTPEGKACRDRMLHEEKYLKEAMENEFRIREEIIYGRTHGSEPSSAARAHSADSRSESAPNRDTVHTFGSAETVGEPTGKIRGAEFATGGVPETSVGDSQRVSYPNADGRAVESCKASGTDERTGWEEERETFFSNQHQFAQPVSASPVSESDIDTLDIAGLVGVAIQLSRSLECDQYAEPVMDSTTMRHHTDSKILRKEMEKKIALGYKVDDQEEQTWQQTM